MRKPLLIRNQLSAEADARKEGRARHQEEGGLKTEAWGKSTGKQVYKYQT